MQFQVTVQVLINLQLQRKGFTGGSTANRSDGSTSKIRFNTTTNLLELQWYVLEIKFTHAAVSNVSGDVKVTNLLTISITGQFFNIIGTAQLISNGGTTINICIQLVEMSQHH